ncbi:MAG: YidC/Oxa1 family membrane protein insertase [Candidatus Dormibacteraeota bacterium]|nr:YidC/Oxa1 family membrane protein insertase [Candidatus Dormibacteraeota bacterium]
MPSVRQGRLRSCSLTPVPTAHTWRPDIYLAITDIFLPIYNLWKVVFENNLAAVLNFIYVHFSEVPMFSTIGAYGLAIVVLTIGIRLILAPLQQFQLVTQRKSMFEQRKLAPQVAELRKKYKKDAQRLNSEMQKLYQEHGVNPFAGLVGCLPLIVQLPILTALYYVFTGFAKHATVAAHFLFIPNLNDNPNQHLLLHLPIFGIGIPTPEYLIFPLLAAATTYVQTKMLQMPPAPNPTEQEQQTQQMQRMMVWLSPLMIGYFALQVPAGLGLYWFIGNCVGIIQQSFVVGWGNLLPGRSAPRVAGAALVDPRGGGGSKSGPRGGSSGPGNLKDGPKNEPKNGPQNGPNRKKPKR